MKVHTHTHTHTHTACKALHIRPAVTHIQMNCTDLNLLTVYESRTGQILEYKTCLEKYYIQNNIWYNTNG